MVVAVTGGIIRGERLSCGLFCSYSSFKGIPYAKAPVGDLRFRAPVPTEGWEGVREANEHTVVCPQVGIFGINPDDEDCLSLNVYSPNMNGRLPVMVWIYGGAFRCEYFSISSFCDVFTFVSIAVVDPVTRSFMVPISLSAKASSL